MIATAELKQIARARLRDAQILLKSKRWDGAVYICGYALETALKARLCKTLSWPAFPETNREFDDYKSFRTHKLEVLLTLSGYEAKIKSRYAAEWSAVLNWDPESRYSRVGFSTELQANTMIQATAVLLRVILRSI